MEEYRVVLSCWDYGNPKPYADSFARFFDTEEQAREAIEKAVEDELAVLNEGREKVPVKDSDGNVVYYDYDFRGDENGNHANIVRLWDGDDYQNVTAYDIHKLTSDAKKISDCSYVKYRGFWVLPNKEHNLFRIEQHDVCVAAEKTLSAALGWIDEFHLVFERERGSATRPTLIVGQEETVSKKIFINKLDGLKLSHKEFVDFVFGEAKRQFDDCHDNEKWDDLSDAEKDLIFHEQYDHQLKDRDWKEIAIAPFEELSSCKDFKYLKDYLSNEKLAVIKNILEAYSAGRINIKIVRDKDEQIDFDKSFDLLSLDPDYRPLTKANGDRAWLEEVVIKWYEGFEDTGYLMEYVRDLDITPVPSLDEQIARCARSVGNRDVGQCDVDRGTR